MKKIDKILEEKLQEMFNPNDLAYQSKEFSVKIAKVREVDNVNDTTEESDVDIIEKLKNIIHEYNEDVDIKFDDGNMIRLDTNIIKYMFANYSDEQIIDAFSDHSSLTYMLHDMFDVVYLDKELQNEIEEEEE